MPYVAQDGVCCGLRDNFGAEATMIADSGNRCHISVASEFRVGRWCWYRRTSVSWPMQSDTNVTAKQ